MEQKTIEQLKSLKTLLDSGILSQEEFEMEKKKVMEASATNRTNKTHASEHLANRQTENDATENVRNKLAYDSTMLAVWATIVIACCAIQILIATSNDLWFTTWTRPFYFIASMIAGAANMLPVLSIKDYRHKNVLVVCMAVVCLYVIISNITNIA